MFNGQDRINVINSHCSLSSFTLNVIAKEAQEILLYNIVVILLGVRGLTRKLML